MLLTRNLQNSRNGLIVILEYMPDIIGNVLVDEDDSDIVPFGEVEECFFDLLEFGVCFDDEEVGGVCGTVSDPREEESADGVLCGWMWFGLVWIRLN